MPTYSYSCRDCGHVFDIHQAFTDDALTACPTCPGKLRKVFGTVGVTFKGSGFYRTDSHGGTRSPKQSSSGESSANPAASTAASTAASSSPSSGSAA